jgi:hypothetical protein
MPKCCSCRVPVPVMPVVHVYAALHGMPLLGKHVLVSLLYFRFLSKMSRRRGDSERLEADWQPQIATMMQ